MGQKVNPIGLRIGIIKDWKSRWYATGPTYIKWLHEDIAIRRVLQQELNRASLSRIEIERLEKSIIILIYTARPGVVLGQEGKNIGRLKLLIQKTLKDRHLNLQINVIEVKQPALDARLVANAIAEQIANRASFRLAQKTAIRRTLEAGALGIKTLVSGRLGGADIARSEGYMEGTVPLATLRHDIDYALSEAKTTYGQISVKVWIARGEILPGEMKRQQRSEQSRYRYQGRDANSKSKNFKNNFHDKLGPRTADTQPAKTAVASASKKAGAE